MLFLLLLAAACLCAESNADASIDLASESADLKDMSANAAIKGANRNTTVAMVPDANACSALVEGAGQHGQGAGQSGPLIKYIGKAGTFGASAHTLT